MSAEELYKTLQNQGERIGLSTVYRTLHLLARIGILRELELAEGHKHYELNLPELHNHHHLVCTGCNSIIEFEDETIEKLQDDIAARHGFLIKSHKLEIYGLCTNCRK